MSQRFNAYKGTYAEGMAQTEAALAASPLDPLLRHLVKLRVSQINGCAFCIDMHLKEARDDKEEEKRLEHLVAWREFPDYTPAERAALNWAELLTVVTETRSLDAAYEALSGQFSEDEIRALTYTIIMINAWNRLQVAMHGRMDALGAPGAPLALAG